MDRIALVGCGENKWIGDFIRVIRWAWSIDQRKLLDDFCVHILLWNYCRKTDAEIVFSRE